MNTNETNNVTPNPQPSNPASDPLIANSRAAVERFIRQQLLSEATSQGLDPDQPLVSSGLIDSLGMLRLITFLEQSLGIQINDGDVLGANFETLSKILAFVEQKQSGSGGEGR